tara:strand:- start:24 stop:449 length:426 start_codon:yes stop_codon:yes gene_type:complete
MSALLRNLLPQRCFSLGNAGIGHFNTLAVCVLFVPVDSLFESGQPIAHVCTTRPTPTLLLRQQVALLLPLLSPDIRKPLHCGLTVAHMPFALDHLRTYLYHIGTSPGLLIKMHLPVSVHPAVDLCLSIEAAQHKRSQQWWW